MPSCVCLFVCLFVCLVISPVWFPSRSRYILGSGSRLSLINKESTTTFFLSVLGFEDPLNLITGLSGWRTPDQPLRTHEPVPDRRTERKKEGKTGALPSLWCCFALSYYVASSPVQQQLPGSTTLSDPPIRTQICREFSPRLGTPIRVCACIERENERQETEGESQSHNHSDGVSESTNKRQEKTLKVMCFIN